MNAIFSTQEAISRRAVWSIMCLYGLQKAFDSVEILLLSFPGWHQLKSMAPLHSWYKNCRSSVCLGSLVSSSGTGSETSSILSPSLFLLIVDPLLRRLHSHSLGVSINNMYAGAYLHADDIHTFSTTIMSMEAQIQAVADFTKDKLKM